MSDVIDHVDTPISTEAWGRARDIRRQVEREGAALDREVNAIVRPIVDRLHRHPRRALRPDMTIAALRDWTLTDARQFRLDLHASMPSKSQATLIERRVVAGRLRRPDWIGDEADLGITEISLRLGKGLAHLRTRCLAIFSLHAIARRLQRHADGSIDRLLADMDLAASAAREGVVAGGGYKVTTCPLTGGGWRGRGMTMPDADGGSVTVLSVRTWIEN